jgi:hypothetical protein
MLIVALLNAFAIFWFFRLIRNVAVDPMVRGLLVAVVIILMVGGVVYRGLEGWSFLDSVYFSAVTLCTVGYGDLAPQTAGGKLFTIFYMFIGVGLFATAATMILQRSRFWVQIEKRAAEADGAQDGSENRDVAAPGESQGA